MPDETPLTDDQIIVSPFDSADLAGDEDLTMWERKMPTMAQTMNVYSGKRFLAKNFIRKTLLKVNIDPSLLGNPNQLKDAAVFKELELIFRDMSDKPESIAGAKANYYAKLFESEMELIILTLTSA